VGGGVGGAQYLGTTWTSNRTGGREDSRLETGVNFHLEKGISRWKRKASDETGVLPWGKKKRGILQGGETSEGRGVHYVPETEEGETDPILHRGKGIVSNRDTCSYFKKGIW